jgi:hypothetical protein
MTRQPGWWERLGRVIDETWADLCLRVREVFDVPVIREPPDPMAGRWSGQEPATPPPTHPPSVHPFGGRCGDCEPEPDPRCACAEPGAFCQVHDAG